MTPASAESLDQSYASAAETICRAGDASWHNSDAEEPGNSENDENNSDGDGGGDKPHLDLARRGETEVDYGYISPTAAKQRGRSPPRPLNAAAAIAAAAVEGGVAEQTRSFGDVFRYHCYRKGEGKQREQREQSGSEQHEQPQTQDEQVVERQQGQPQPQPQQQPQSQSQSQPRRQRRRQLTRDQRRDILLLRRLGHNHHQIATHLGLTVSSVQYTCYTRRASPKRRPGRARILTDARLAEIEAFITASVANRRLNYGQLIEALALDDVKEDTLTVALRRRGFVRRMAFLRSDLAPSGGSRTAKPVRTWLTCRKDEVGIDSPDVLEIVGGNKGGERSRSTSMSCRRSVGMAGEEEGNDAVG